MAEVDFSNAKIAPYAYTNVGSTPYDAVNPTYRPNVSLNQTTLWNVNFGQVGSGTITQLKNQQKQLVYLYQGTFTASGTEFYLLDYTGGAYKSTSWKISNISFQNGDTFIFKIRADLICQ